MRPVRLEFSGLRSYRQRTTIDFADLDLFAIIGDTGAGKSTVIEALSLALYGRKTWSGGSNLEELIADGENTMAIELVFAAEGNEWTVTRSRHRNSSAPINKLECPDLGEKVDGNKAVNERIEQLLGLDHSQFVRAVVLPQGRFDELLQATRTDRNKILRSIFGLDDLRRVRDDATRRREHWRPVVEAATARRDALDPNPAQSLATARSAVVTLQQHLEMITGIAEAVDRNRGEIETLDRRLATTSTAAEQLAFDEHLADDVPALVEHARLLVAERTQLQTRQVELAALRQETAEQQTMLLEGFENQAGAVQGAALLRSVASSLADLDADVAAAQAEIERLVSATPSAEEPPELVAAVDDAQERAKAAIAEFDGVGRRAADAVMLWQQFSVTNAELAAARQADTEAVSTAADAASAATRALAAVETATDALAEAKTANDRAIQNHAAAAVAHGLEPGHTCPVCSQVVPEGFVAPVVSDLETAAAGLEEAERDLVAAQRSATTAEATATHTAQAAASAKVALEEALIRIGERRAAVAAANLDPEASDEIAALAAIRSEQHRAESVVNEARGLLEAAERARAKAHAERSAAVASHERELAAARANEDRMEARRLAQRNQLRNLPTSWIPGDDATAEQIEGVAERIDRRLVELEKLLDRGAEAAQAEVAANQRFAELRSDAIENITAPMAEILRALNSRIEAARSLVEAGDPPGGAQAVGTRSIGSAMPQVPDLLPDSVLLDEVQALGPQIDRCIELLAPVVDHARDLRRQLDEERLVRSNDVAQALARAGVADPGALHRAVGVARAEAAQAERDVARFEDQLEQADRLDALLATGRPYLANLEVLIQSLRDQHFVDHLVSAREVELLAEATRRLKAISGDRYGFVPDFGVVRIATGEVRSPDTLSGGERFQAALALALALVEIASRGAGKLDAVFVDEGFGSLDSAALDVALDTLGSVAGGGKLVALISHLHPVAEYVDTVFNVTKDDLFGSSIAKLDAEAREELLADDIRSGLTS